MMCWSLILGRPLLASSVSFEPVFYGLLKNRLHGADWFFCELSSTADGDGLECLRFRRKPCFSIGDRSNYLSLR
jgi:hypothetical protein